MTTGPPSYAGPSPEPPQDDATASAISMATRGGRGALSVVAFTSFLNVIQLASALVLARQLAPEQYGAFAVGATIVGFGRFLGDGGAGSAVIQQPGGREVSRRDLGRVLLLQATIATTAAVLLVLAAPLVRSAFDTPADTVGVIIGMALALVIEVPVVVPKVRLSRRQQYQRLQVLGAVAYAVLYAVQIGGLLLGYGLWALVAGQLAYSCTSVVVMLVWGGGLVRPVVKGSLTLARRGLPYQGAFAVQALFSICSIAVVGTQLSTSELGLWTWCTVLATPLIALTGALRGVTFPALSRLHEHHRSRHGEALAMVARLQFLFVSAVVGVLCGLTVPLVRHLFDERWLGAVDAVRAALLGVLPLVLAGLLAAGVESSGRPHLRLQAMLGGTVTGVLVAIPLSAYYGTTGAAISTFLVVPLVDAVLLLRVSPVDIRRAVIDAVLVGLGSFSLAILLAQQVDGLGSLLLVCCVTGVFGLALIPLVDSSSLRVGWRLVRSQR